MRLTVLLAALWTALLQAQPALGAARTRVDLVAVTTHAVPGQEAVVALRFRCDPHFHIYWKNPGDAGEAPAWKWTTNADANRRSLDFATDAEWPAPKRIDLQGVINFAYEGETHLYLKAKVPKDAKGAFKLAAHVTWLECDDNGCYPHEADASLTLPVGASDTRNLPADWSRVPRETYTVKGTASTGGDRLRLTETLTGRTLGTVLQPAEWFPERNFVTPSTPFGPVAMTGGGNTALAIASLSLKDATEKLADGPVSYIAEVKDNLSQQNRWVRVLVDLTSEPAPKAPTDNTPAPNHAPDASHSAGPIEWQPWSREAEAAALAAGKVVYIDFTARWCATCQVNKRVYADAALQAEFAKAGVVTLKADWTRKDPAITEELNRLGRQGIPLNVFRRKDAPPVILSELLTADQVREGLSASLANRKLVSEERGSAGMLLLAFLGGALLNLMPCVFPVIGLKVLAFAGQAGSDRPAALRQSLAYALGVLVSFLALGLLALALKSGWGAQMQSPLFVLLTTALMVTMGMSLAGAFEIGTGLASTAASTGNAGAFLSGVLATAVATPCTAPGLGAALGFALDPVRSTTETLAFFAVIGIGMALPYVLLVAFPALSRALPRPGEWMETLKQAMAFPLFGYALYLLWVLSALVEDVGWVRDASLGLVVLAACCWAWGRWGAPHRTERERLWGRLISGTLYLATLAHLAYHLP